jgi:hypothetical protein
MEQLFLELIALLEELGCQLSQSSDAHPISLPEKASTEIFPSASTR